MDSTEKRDKHGSCDTGLASGRVFAQQANRPIVCQGFVAESSCKKGQDSHYFSEYMLDFITLLQLTLDHMHL